MDTNIFYPEQGRSPIARDEAYEICDRCPVDRQCFQYALANGETRGIWGGVMFRSNIEHRMSVRLRARLEETG